MNEQQKNQVTPLNPNEKKSLLESILGSEIFIPTSNKGGGEASSVINIVSDSLFGGLQNYFNSTAPYFQTSLSLDKIVQYKNGSFSSMEKSLKGGFSHHHGFDIVNGMDLTHKLMSYIMPILNQRLTSIYSDLISQNNYYLNQIRNLHIIPEISRLKSISEFIKGIHDDIQEISKSDRLSIANLTSLQGMKIDLKEIFHSAIARLEQLVIPSNFEPNEVANSYLVARFSLSNYIVSLVFECILSGNIDDNSVIRLESKIEECLVTLNDITDKLSGSLEQLKRYNSQEIYNINFAQWSYSILQSTNQINNLNNQNFNIDQIQYNTLSYFDINLEKKRLKEFMNSRHSLINNIKIIEDAS